MLQELSDYTKELQKVYDETGDLRKVSQYSFEQRESGRNVPYMAITSKDMSGEVTCIMSSPTAAQKELKEFFSQPAPGFKKIPRYYIIFEMSGMWGFMERSKDGGIVRHNKIV